LPLPAPPKIGARKTKNRKVAVGVQITIYSSRKYRIYIGRFLCNFFHGAGEVVGKAKFIRINSKPSRRGESRRNRITVNSVA